MLVLCGALVDDDGAIRRSAIDPETIGTAAACRRLPGSTPARLFPPSKDMLANRIRLTAHASTVSMSSAIVGENGIPITFDTTRSP